MERFSRRFSFFKKIKEYSSRHPFMKFLFVFIVFLSYFFLSSLRRGFSEGIGISLITWSFFVFCTPIADAGILIDFPLRFFTGMRMVYSEIIVWCLSAGINLFFFFKNNSIYNSTFITVLFKKILITPFPYYLIIILSGLGTFISINFADEILDVLSNEKNLNGYYKKHNLKYKFIIFIFLLVLIVFMYNYLLNTLNLDIPLF